MKYAPRIWDFKKKNKNQQMSWDSIKKQKLTTLWPRSDMEKPALFLVTVRLTLLTFSMPSRTISDQINCWHKKFHLDKEFHQACLSKTLLLSGFSLYVWVEHRQFSDQHGIFSEEKIEGDDRFWKQNYYLQLWQIPWWHLQEFFLLSFSKC